MPFAAALDLQRREYQWESCMPEAIERPLRRDDAADMASRVVLGREEPPVPASSISAFLGHARALSVNGMSQRNAFSSPSM